MLLLLGSASPLRPRRRDKEKLQMMADIRMLQEQAQQLQNLLGAVSEALKAVNARLDQQTETNRRAFADQKSTIDTLADDLRVVRESVDDNNVRIGSVTQEVEALRQSVELLERPRPGGRRRRGTHASIAGGPRWSAGSAPRRPRLLRPASAAVGMSPTAIVRRSQGDVPAGQNDLAVMGFESYIKTFPKSEQADDAQF